MATGMMTAIRWHGIKGETIGAGTPHAMEVIRVQTSKDGPWQSLDDVEIEALLVLHNKSLEQPKPKEVKIDAGQRGAAKEAAAARKSMVPKPKAKAKK
jgi:hypothetical protein